MHGLQSKGRTALNFRFRKYLASTALIVFLVDYATKAWALSSLDSTSRPFIGKLLQFKLAKNSGAAFSLASSGTIFLSGFAIAMIFVILYFGTKVFSKPWAIAMGLALGGVLGNLSDRIFRPPYRLQGEVIDFLELPHWPIFNIADCAVVSAAILIGYLNLKNVPFKKS